jgi:integrase
MLGKHISVYTLKSKDRPFYKLEWVEPGTDIRRSKSAGTADPREAERLRAELEYELNHGLHREPARVPWQDFAERYAEEKLADRRKATLKKWGYVADSFAELARPKNLAAVDASMLSKYTARLRQEGCEKATIAGHLAYLRAALRWAARQGYIPSAPLVEMPKLPKKVCIRKTDQAGYLKILNAAPDDDWRPFITAAWFTGLRRGELMALEWSGDNGAPWVDLERGRIWLPAEWCKSDADSWLPLHPDLAAVLKSLRQGPGRVFRLSASANEVSRTFTAIAKAAGVPITLHDLRRSFGSRYATKVPAPVLQRLMRHSDIRTTLTFYADVEDALEEAIKLA